MESERRRLACRRRHFVCIRAESVRVTYRLNGSNSRDERVTSKNKKRVFICATLLNRAIEIFLRRLLLLTSRKKNLDCALQSTADTGLSETTLTLPEGVSCLFTIESVF